MIFSIEAITALAFLVIIPIAISFWSKSSLFRSIRGRHVVITGGSTGIGLWMAIQCVKLGAHVTIISRNVTKLESAIKLIKLFRMNDKQSIEFRSIDLSKSYEAVEKLFGALEEQVAPIYWLINCAGGEMHGRHIDMFQENANDLINSKYFAVYYPIRYVIAKMNVMGEGKITITGSQAKELLMELYGHKIFGCRECKLSSHGLPEIMNMKGLNKNISITLALTDKSETTELENVNESTTEDQDQMAEISKVADFQTYEDMANKIVFDSMSGKFISTSGWESWLHVTVLKFAHLLQTILLLKQRFFSKTKQQPIKLAQLPLKSIDSKSPQAKIISEQSSNVPIEKSVGTEMASSSTHSEPSSSNEISEKSSEHNLIHFNDTVAEDEKRPIAVGTAEKFPTEIDNKRTVMNIEESSHGDTLNKQQSPDIEIFETKKARLTSSTANAATSQSQTPNENTFTQNDSKKSEGSQTSPLATENTKPVDKEFAYSLFGSTKDQFENDASNGLSATADSKNPHGAIGMEIFGDHIEKKKPLAEKNNLKFRFVSTDDAVKSNTKPIETGPFVFGGGNFASESKPFTFEAKPTENSIPKSNVMNINCRTKLPLLRLKKRTTS